MQIKTITYDPRYRKPWARKLSQQGMIQINERKFMLEK